jgi:hypothetical protein
VLSSSSNAPTPTTSAALVGAGAARAIDDQSTHGARGIRQEVCAILEVDVGTAREIQVRLVHQRGGAHAAPRARVPELPARQAVQLAVEVREQLLTHRHVHGVDGHARGVAREWWFRVRHLVSPDTSLRVTAADDNQPRRARTRIVGRADAA